MIITTRRQHRILAEIRRALRRSDPRLVARFTMFTRFTQHEEMPRLERIRLWPRRWVVSATGRRVGGISHRLAAIAVIPAMAAVLISVPFILGHGRATASCTGAAVTRARSQPRAFSPPIWTVPSCRASKIGHVSVRGG
jgi:Protein of unknown function (DUF3040)